MKRMRGEIEKPQIYLSAEDVEKNRFKGLHDDASEKTDSSFFGSDTDSCNLSKLVSDKKKLTQIIKRTFEREDALEKKEIKK
jgi:hypothetical protein